MNKRDAEYFRKKLLAEKAELEEDLNGIAKRSPGSAGGWEPAADGTGGDSADENEVADKLEEYEENAGIATQLENQLKEVVGALERIENGTYGKCDICGKPIEKERLEANPSASISIKHSH